MKFAKYRCTQLEQFRPVGKTHTCGKVFIAMSDRHRMDYCPNHEGTYVDMEKDYVRKTLTAEFIESFEPPWFDDEDEYHSALMSWLNDSDEEFNLEIYCGVLYVLRCDVPVVAVTDAQHNVSDHSKIPVKLDHAVIDAARNKTWDEECGGCDTCVPKEEHVHDWRLVVRGEYDTFVCHTCRATKREGFTPCASERPARKTICQANKGHTGSHHAVIYWEDEPELDADGGRPLRTWLPQYREWQKTHKGGIVEWIMDDEELKKEMNSASFPTPFYSIDEAKANLAARKREQERILKIIDEEERHCQALAKQDGFDIKLPMGWANRLRKAIKGGAK